MNILVPIRKTAKFRKLDTLEFSFNTNFKPVLRRADWKPNAVAREDLFPGSYAVVKTLPDCDLYEIFSGPPLAPWPWPKGN